MKLNNFSFVCILSIFCLISYPKSTNSQQSNQLSERPEKLFDKLSNFDTLIAQTGVSEIDRQIPETPDPERVISDPEQIRTNFDYEDVDYWKNLCDLFRRTNQIAKANEACNRVVELNDDDDDPDVWVARGISLHESGEYVEAIASFSEAIDISEDYSLALANRCASYFQLALYEDAIADCVEALDKDGDWKDSSPASAFYYQGLAFSRLERLEAALVNFKKAILHTPEYNLAHAERCRVLLNLELEGERVQPCFENKAIARYNLALAENPNNVVAWTNLGLYFSALDRRQEAADSYDRALEILPQSSFILANRCQVANDLGNFKPALSYCDSALNGDRIFGSLELASVWSQQSRALVGLKQYKEALNSADRAIALNSGIAQSWNNRGVSLWYLQKPQEALAALQRAINIDPEYTRGLFNYGRVLSSLSQYEEALDFYNRALETNSGNLADSELSAIWVNKSFAQFNTGSCEQAFRSAKKAVSFNSQSFEGWYNQGIALACLEEYRLALDAYSKAGEIRPENVDVLTARAVALEKLGLNRRALKIVEEALDLNGDYQPAINIRDKLLRNINADS